MKSFQYVIGVDEAGRGPLAGPVSVGVACVPPDFNWDLIPGVDDSKKLTEKKREFLYTAASQLKHEQRLFFAVGLVSASHIDACGIVPSVNTAMEQALAQLREELVFNPADTFVKLDGSLKAPEEYLHQETIIKGDSKEKVIGLASIVAKVTRDRYMQELATQEAFHAYGFEIHKGYGTKSHRALIEAHGLSSVHRKSFCKKLSTN